MIYPPTPQPASQRRRRFHPARSTTIVMVSAAAVLLRTAGAPAPSASAATATVSYTYDAAGRLATVTTAAGTATYHYDAEGNLLSISSPAAVPPPTAARTGQAAPRPVITAAGPPVVAPGKTITIKGRGFSPAAITDLVRVGALLAHVTAASATQLTVAAPPGTGGAVRVTTPSGTAHGPKVRITEPRIPAPPAQGRDRHPLRAAAGVTALSGLVEDNHGRPLPGVAISLASLSGQQLATTVTAASGRFLLTHLAPGRHQLIIAANHLHSRPSYGIYAEPVELPTGRTTVLPWITYLTPLDQAHTVTIPSPTTRQVTLTTPKIPGLKIQIPKGTVITGHNGRPVTKLSITPLTVGRTAYPLAPGMQPGFFTLQPGDATVHGPGLRVIYPNGAGHPPGTAVPLLTDSPTWPGMGWWRYGTGHVTPNGKQIIPDPGTRWHLISLGGYPITTPPPGGPPPCGAPPAGGGGSGGGEGDGNTGPPPDGPNSCPQGGGGPGDPVSLATGLWMDQATDLTLPDVESVQLTRTFRQLDPNVRDFGIGASSGLNFYIALDNSSGDFNLYNPAGGVISYAPTGTTGLYQSVGSPTIFAGSTLNWLSTDADGPFTIHLTNGTVLSFGNPAYLTQITDRFGNAITINRDIVTVGVQQVQTQIRTITTPDGEWMKFTYGNCMASNSAITCITQVTDNSGRTLTYSYDANGRLTSVTNPAGGVTSYTWAPCPTQTAITCTELLTATDPDGHVTTNTYDPATGRVTGQTDGVGNTWSYSYTTNSSGQITQATVTDPRGVHDTYSFNPAGLLSSVTDAAGTPAAQTTTTAFDPTTNLLTSETDPLGRTTSYTYDNLGNVTSLTELAGTAHPSTWTFTYEPTYNRITSETNPLGHTTTIAYNDSTQTETVTDPLGHQSVITLNNEGQQIEITNPVGGSTYLSYLYGDLVAIANPLGQTSTIYYDSVSQPLQITDPQGNTTSDTWAPLGQLASQTEPLGAATSYGYDSDGNLTSVTDANSHTTTFTYDGDSQVMKKTDPLGNVTRYTYDGDRNLASVTDANKNIDTFTYDNLNNLATARYGVSGTTQQTKIVYTHDAANRLTKAAQTPGGTYSLKYDGLNDMLSQASPAGTVSHTYNTAGLPTSLAVPGQSKVTYTYDSDSHITKITQGATNVTLTYDAASRLSAATLPDGIKQANTYDAASDLTGQTFKHGTTSVGAINYGYTADSQISSESGSLASATLPPALTGTTYNADNELTSSGGTTYSYDKNGNRTSNGANTYTWNAQNQLTGISGAVTAAFGYNPFGQQASAAVGGTATSYLHDGTAWNSNVVQEQTGGTPAANLLTGAPGQIFQLTTPAGTNSSLLTGPLGSTIALASASGQITTSYSYDPNGTVTTTGASSPNTFEFNATQNNGTGLDLMGARYYDPATGTFISQDPTGFHGDITNLYNYANNDPINQSDPTGCLSRENCIALAAGLFAIGFALLALSGVGAAIDGLILTAAAAEGVWGLVTGTGIGLAGIGGDILGHVLGNNYCEEPLYPPRMPD
jgi:RHS repeat-associated protein